MGLFGTSGIREPCPSKIDARLAMAVGRLMAGGAPALVVGYDGRRTGPMLKAALAAGAAGSGTPVLDAGFCATPTLAYYARALGADGAMITASHNPPEYNGIKLFERGLEMPREREARIEEGLAAVLGGKTPGAWPDYTKAGEVRDVQEEARKKHLELLLSRVDTGLIRKRRPKVVLDCANLAGGALMPRALTTAGAEVIVINGRTGEPYGRELEPKESTLGALMKEVVRQGADMGIAHDGDADRAIIVDEKGGVPGLDVQLAMAVQSVLETDGDAHKAARGKVGKAPARPPTVVSTVESSLSLLELCETHGAELAITPVGSLKVAQRMRQAGAVFGGEPCGEYLFKDGTGSPDGLMAGLFFVEMFCRHGALSARAAAIPRYPIGREKIPCPPERKAGAMERIEHAWPFSRPSGIDGFRSDEADGWVLVRPSGTEPCIRITIEARNEGALALMTKKARALVKKACEG
ncbi:MAG: hypothetical protein V1728_02615 [Candidatus Micrarchaeota archaeon]